MSRYSDRPIVNSSSSGIGFCGLLTILFIGLKLCGVIDWSWWWVLAPLWIPTILVIIILLIASVILVKGNHNKWS